MMRIRAICWCGLLVLGLVHSNLRAEAVATIRQHGDPANRLDLVILGDGYTASQQKQYEQDVERLVRGFFAQQPFQEYQNYFNVHRINVASAEAGADHPEVGRGIYRSTAFDATYDCSGIPRLICVDTGKVETVLANSIANEAQRDFTIVLVNDPTYGGSGGRVAVASLDASVIELILHEFGHSFGLLGDEYEQQPPGCELAPNPEEPNVSSTMARGTIKWNHGGGPPFGWIESATALPTSSTAETTVGAFSGARYCSSGLYRPSFTSKMRELGQPYKQVNEEQLVKRIYNFTGPIDSVVPNSNLVAVAYAGRQLFEIRTPTPATHPLTISWLVDQQEQARGSAIFELDAKGLAPGVHTVQALSQDLTDKVRYDERGLLRDTHTWEVDVGSLPATDFSSFRGVIELSRKMRPAGSFSATGRVVVSPSGDGIHPTREALTLSISAANMAIFSQTLAPGKLKMVAPRTYEYRPPAARGGINFVQLVKLKPLTYRFRVSAERLDLHDVTSAALTLGLEIGDDKDQYTASCRKFPARRVKCL